jgi:hypothetical protein
MAQSVEGHAIDWRAQVQFLSGTRDSSLVHSIQSGSWAHAASSSMCNVGSFPMGEMASADAKLDVYLQSSMYIHGMKLN